MTNMQPAIAATDEDLAQGRCVVVVRTHANGSRSVHPHGGPGVVARLDAAGRVVIYIYDRVTAAYTGDYLVQVFYPDTFGAPRLEDRVRDQARARLAERADLRTPQG